MEALYKPIPARLRDEAATLQSSVLHIAPMTKFSVAIAGGGIAGLALAAELSKNGNIRVDVYEASNKFDEIGAGITLWGRVCEALQLMGLADECIQAAVVVASTSGLKTTTGFNLRGFHQLDEDFGTLPFKDAWSLHRADLLKILLRRVPKSNTHLNKKLARYTHNDASQTTTLEFHDGTWAYCDVLVGCDGIRSATRAHMMRQAKTYNTGSPMRYIEPRWTGTVAYRVLASTARLGAKNSHHSMLTGGQIYFGKNQHVVGYPISPSTLNIAISITDLSKEDTPWPEPSWSKTIDLAKISREISPLFSDWDSEVQEVIECVDSAIAWAIHDLEPLPFYVKGNVALVGDAAHAAMPYLGAGAAYAIEDAYVLSRILCTDATTRETLPLALDAYQRIRRPYGNKLITNARHAAREFQYNGPDGDDMLRIKDTLRRIFEESAAVGRSGPEADANTAISWLEENL